MAIVITYDGTDITDSVIFADAQFTMQVNGVPGTCTFRVRDNAHTSAFSAGKELTLDIDGTRMWGGFVSLVASIYSNSVVDTTNAGSVVREFRITGVDYNILFDRRIMFNKANPTRRIPNYPRGVSDAAAILDISSKFLDLSGDGLSFANVDSVGTPNPDMAGNLGAPADPWSLSMSLIARYTGAVYFIDPDKVVNYVDSHTATTSYYLTDQPDPGDPFAVGYRDLMLTSDGSNLDNDALVWGAGQGLSAVNFKRIQSTSSQAIHGRWQVGEFDYNLYTDGALTNRASTLVSGSPQNRRGAKDDAVSWEVALFRPIFRAGDITTIMVKSHDRGTNQDPPFDTDKTWPQQTDVPVRRVTITFPTPNHAMYRLTVSHNIDLPWMGYEFWYPDINIPRPPDFPPVLPGTEDACSALTPVVTDTFGGVIGTGTNGSRSWGSNWTVDVFGDAPEFDPIHWAAFVNASGHLMPDMTETFAGAPIIFANQVLGASGGSPADVLFRMRFRDQGGNVPTVWTSLVQWWAGVGTDLSAFNSAGPSLNPKGGFETTTIRLNTTNTAGGLFADVVLSSTSDYFWVRSQYKDNSFFVKAWQDGDTEPLDWAIFSTLSAWPGDNANFYIKFEIAQVFSAPGIGIEMNFFQISSCTGSGGTSGGAVNTCESFTGGGDVFNTSYPYVGGFVQVFVNGLLQRLIDDYIEADSVTGLIQLITAAEPDDVVVICYIPAGYAVAP